MSSFSLVSHLVAQTTNRYIGSNTSGNIVDFTNGITNYDNTYIGYSNIASENVLSVGNTNTLYSNNNDIYIGYAGSKNTMVVYSGARVANSNGWIGYSNSSSNNLVWITEPNATWNNNGTLIVGYNGSSNQLEVTLGATLTSKSSWIGYSNSASSNIVSIANSNSIWSNAGSLNIGYDGCSNTLIVSNGGCVDVIGSTTSDYFSVGNDTGSNNAAIITGSDSTLYVNTNGHSPFGIVIGYYNNNSMTISDGAKVFSKGSSYIGWGSSNSSNNSVLVTGSGSAWSNGDTLTIGLYGSGNSLTIADEGMVSASNGVFIGSSTNSSNNVLNIGTFGGKDTNVTLATPSINFGSGGGTLNFNQSDTNTISSTISDSGNGVIQQLGSGTTILTGSNSGFSGFTKIDYGVLQFGDGVTSGGSAVAGDILNNASLVFDPSSSDTYTVAGNISGSGSLSMIGSGALNITGSNTYSGGSIFDGGTSTITGSIDSTNSLAVGYNHSGASMVISDGGLVSDYYGVIGYTNSSLSNSVLVTGSGSLWSNSGDLYVGLDGSGNSMVITNGGVVQNANGYIGYSSNSSNNTVLVTGSGSLWSNSGAVYVGTNGSSNNTLTIADKGKVIAPGGIYIGTNNSTNNALNIGTPYGNDTGITLDTPIIYISPIGGTLNIFHSDRTQFTNNIADSGTGFMNRIGLGVTELTGDISQFSGMTVIDTGTIQIGNGRTLGAAPPQGIIRLTNSGTLAFDSAPSEIYVETAIISGDGTLNHIGPGATILTGSNRYGGFTTISAGKLTAANSSALGTSAVNLRGASSYNTATLSLGTSLTITELNWGGSGIVELSPGSQILTVTGVITNSSSQGGTFSFLNPSLENDTNVLICFGSQVGFTTNSFSVAGISGYSFDLTSTNLSCYIATNANVIIATNSTINTTLNASSVTITPSGSLNGVGTLNAPLTNNGLLSPGYPTGTLSINGNVTQSSSGTLQINVESSNNYGQLQVNGSVTLAGTLEITPILGSSLSYGERLTFLNSSGPIKGSFDTVQIDEPYCRGRVQIIGDPQAIVTIAPTSYTLLAQNQNEFHVATALDSFITATRGDELVVSTDLDSLTAAQYPGAFEQIMPTLYQSLSTIAFNIDNAQNQELIQRLWGVRLASATEYGGNFNMSGFAEKTPLLEGQGNTESQKDILRPGPDNHWGMFVDGNGIFAQANNANTISTYNAESGGVTTGLSYRWNKQVSSGIYTGYQGAYTKFTGQNSGSSLIDNQVNFGLFGTYGEENGGGLFIDALAGGAYDNYQINRTISFGNGSNALNRTAMGTPGAGELNTMVASGYDIRKGNLTFGPLSSLQYQYFGATPFNETGAQSLNLAATGWNTSSMIFSLGGHLGYNWQFNKSLLLIPQISLSWQHQFLENPYTINSTLGSSPSFGTTSSVPLRDTLYTGVGFTLEFTKFWDTSFFYNAAAANQDLISHNIFWSLGYKF
ncbi:MAG: autotransporter domain-containing protein [Chthoniobacterales bacterium]|nr:autotransporter domain-containing protein [Chthoniobacterales bacterium]